MLYQKQIPIKYETDVLVVGGGAAGVVAAVAAARMGRKVLLCEAGGCLGGVGTTGLIPSFSPFWDGERAVSAGIGLEIRNNVCGEYPIETVWTPINHEKLKLEYDRIVEQAGVELLFYTTLFDVVVSGDHIEMALFTTRGGMFAVKASVYLDCTGDGNMIAMAGGDYEIGDENGAVMPPTLCTFWGGVKEEEYRGSDVHGALEKAIADGVFTYEDRHLSGLYVMPDGYAGGNIGHTFYTDPLDEKSLTKAMVWGRKSMLEYTRFYQQYVPGCQEIRLLATANMLGVRESRRITCDYRLTAHDFLTRANFDDEIGRYNYPVDIHVMNTEKSEYQRFQQEYASMRYGKGESYGIPYRSLIPSSLSNALVAGRCIGSDRQMEASIRVMPGCFITGQAAGTAAALAVQKQDVRGISIPQLQRALAKEGAYLRRDLLD